MKFSDISENQWDELSPYLDTCLLPVTGLTGRERPYEATKALERLRDVLDLIEIPFKGRVVTYPACHYGADSPALLEDLCAGAKAAGFRYVVLVTGTFGLALTAPSADLIVAPEPDGKAPDASHVAEAIRRLWSSGSPASNSEAGE
ncbi:DUF2487 family protein [Paenibacillus cisolokensis]|nr:MULTISPECIES: DUF2487 family protein [Paenibacillus]ALS27787.1 hypothetical protein IJ21_23910 [Paenibacillus sp. 32O-W]